MLPGGLPASAAVHLSRHGDDGEDIRCFHRCEGSAAGASLTTAETR